DIAAIAQEARRVGIDIPSVHCGLHWKYTLTDNDAETRSRGLAVLERSLEIGAALGARVLLVVPGVVNAQVSYADAYRRALDGIGRLAKKAEATGVRIGVENVWNRFLLSPLEMRRFIDEVNSPWVGCYFDVGNVLAYGYPQHWIEVLAEKILAVHFKDYRTDVPGGGGFVYLRQGDVPWRAVMESLSKVKYDGYVTAELPPYRYQGDRTVFDTVRAMREILAAAR
ncbi:MAG TPA: sugar phosphate isomerase/epimerase family protein, partial [Limnochordia bacterium]